MYNHAGQAKTEILVHAYVIGLLDSATQEGGGKQETAEQKVQEQEVLYGDFTETFTIGSWH